MLSEALARRDGLIRHVDASYFGSVTASPYLQFMALIHKIIPFSLDMHTLKNWAFYYHLTRLVSAFSVARVQIQLVRGDAKKLKSLLIAGTRLV